jgi:hypothetical protein
MPQIDRGAPGPHRSHKATSSIAIRASHGRTDRDPFATQRGCSRVNPGHHDGAPRPPRPCILATTMVHLGHHDRASRPSRWCILAITTVHSGHHEPRHGVPIGARPRPRHAGYGPARAEPSERSESRRSEALRVTRVPRNQLPRAHTGLGSSRGAASSPRRHAGYGPARAEPSERSESRRSEALRVTRVPRNRRGAKRSGSRGYHVTEAERSAQGYRGNHVTKLLLAEDRGALLEVEAVAVNGRGGLGERRELVEL